MYEKKKLNKSKRQKQPEENIINSIRNRFALKKTNKQKKKPKIIRLIRTLFEQEDDDYYKLQLTLFLQNMLKKIV